MNEKEFQHKKLTEIYEFWYELDKKDKKTLSFAERLLLEYEKILVLICGCCVEESKGHISSEDALQKIRKAFP